MRRPAAVAGQWYPSDPVRLTQEIAAYLETADARSPPAPAESDTVVALVAPHAGLQYSGRVAAHAYRLLRGRSFDVIVLVGPSHYVAFDGVAVWPRGSFATPLGDLQVDEPVSTELQTGAPVIRERWDAHAREHSLEMQLPFLALVAPTVPIVPLVMGHQTRETALSLGDALARVCAGRRSLLIASSDLSHFFDASVAARLDAQVVDHVDRFDDDGLMTRLEARPDHACGGGPIVSVLRAARGLGATTSRVLEYADSGDISGDKTSVVGYLAAAVW